MFESAMLDSTARARSQRRWTTLLSVVIQLTLVGVLLLLPVISPDSIPRFPVYETLMAPQPEAAELKATSVPAQGSPHASPGPSDTSIHEPSSIPQHIDMTVTDASAAPSENIPRGTCVGACGPGSRLGVPHGIGTGSDFVPTVREQEPPKRIKVSVLESGYLLHRVQPVYPPIAKQIGVQGSVVLRAIIGKDGEIQELRVVSGHPLLVRAAKDAVEQWRYRPYLLNGVAVEVDTQVTVNFYLSGR